MAKVQDIMTRNPVTCQETDVVFNAVEVMKRQNVGVVPVVDNNRVCRGIVTDRDMVLQVIYNRKDPGNTILRDIMSTDLITCNTDDDLDTAIQHMRSRKVKRIVVLDHDNHCLGIISEADIAQKVGARGVIGELSKGVYGSAR